MFLAGVLEYLTVEICEISAHHAKANFKKRITPRHVCLAIKNDEELDKLLPNVAIAEGGVLPFIWPQILNFKYKDSYGNKIP